MSNVLNLLETRILLIRNLVQIAFLSWCLYLGVRLAAFVDHFISRGSRPLVERPPGVDAFLPIGALVSLKNWLVNGYIDPVHPAALILLLTFLALALLTRKSFCSWICPVGALSEWLWRGQETLSGVRVRLWPWLDRSLRGLKYLLLAFFIKLILVDMPGPALAGFLSSPYWALSDVKMLHFFTSPTGMTLGIVLLLTLLSFAIRQFWCRYLCPYGALLGFFSRLSPSRISRDRSSCTACGRCDHACPASIRVSARTSVTSMECTGCLSCVSSCPEPGALKMRLAGIGLPGWGFMLLVLAVFAAGVAIGMLSGHWDSVLSYRDYVRLIPLSQRF